MAATIVLLLLFTLACFLFSLYKFTSLYHHSLHQSFQDFIESLTIFKSNPIIPKFPNTNISSTPAPALNSYNHDVVININDLDDNQVWPVIDENDVVVLTENNFSEFVDNNRHVMVMFYAPSFYRFLVSRQGPDFAEAAKLLKGMAVFARVDASVERELRMKYRIPPYPTMHFFVDGVKKFHYSFDIVMKLMTSDNIMDWVKRKMTIGIYNITTLPEAIHIRETESKFVLGIFDSLEDPPVITFTYKVAASIFENPMEQLWLYTSKSCSQVLCTFEAAARALKGKFLFVQVYLDNEDGMERDYKFSDAEDAPTVVAYDKCNRKKDKFNGELTLDNIKSYVLLVSLSFRPHDCFETDCDADIKSTKLSGDGSTKVIPLLPLLPNLMMELERPMPVSPSSGFSACPGCEYWSRELATEFRGGEVVLVKLPAALVKLPAYIFKQIELIEGSPTIYFYQDYEIYDDHNDDDSFHVIGAHNECGRKALMTWVKRKMRLGVYNITTMDEAKRLSADESKLVLGFLRTIELWLFAPTNGSEKVKYSFEEAVEASEGKLLFVYVEMNCEVSEFASSMAASRTLLFFISLLPLFTLYWLTSLSHHHTSPPGHNQSYKAFIEALTIFKSNRYDEPESWPLIRGPLRRIVKASPLPCYNKDFNNLATKPWPLLDDEDVVGLTAHNFTDFVAKNKYVLVMYYATWCNWSEQLAPEYAAAAKMLKGEAVQLAIVDGNWEHGLRSKYHVNDYPTIHLFVGGVRPSVYDSCRERTRDAITTWVKMKLSLGIYSINTMDEAQRVLAAESKLVLGFFDSLELWLFPPTNGSEKVKSSFEEAAEAFQGKLLFVYVEMNREGLGYGKTPFHEFGISGDDPRASPLPCYNKDFNNLETKPWPLLDDEDVVGLTELNITDFVAKNKDDITTWVKMKMSLGIYSINTIDEAQRVLAAESKLVLGFFDRCLELWLFAPRNGSEKILSIFEEAAQAFKGELLFVYVEMNLKLGGTELPLEFGTTVDGPAIVGRKQYFSYDYNMLKGELTLSNIKSFWENFLDDKRLSQRELDLARQAFELVPVGVGPSPSPHQQHNGPTHPPPPPFSPSPSPTSSSPPAEWAAAPPPPTEKSGMNGGQKAGIAMGMMAGAAVVGLVRSIVYSCLVCNEIIISKPQTCISSGSISISDKTHHCAAETEIIRRMESSRGQNGIQLLLAAEQEAQQIVNNARNEKMAKLKLAKEEADREIAQYRAQVEADFQRKIAESSGDSGANVKRLEHETDTKIKHLKIEASRISQDVLQMLLKQVTTVKN
ncbi:hypothetical protein Dsin_004298 [Dipteronia sinensis]|uniref:Thioredoxin domain-containing protein n=1 Tax=Dipteronia sinensis TaxID=43782 RepID=A0AAE0ELR3_9ROSI|nr:hypothetical protein Dsin_004298 [Dipteronia sinensis]